MVDWGIMLGGGNALHVVLVSVHIQNGVVWEDRWSVRVVCMVDIGRSLLA
jgi:hypothetical protein